MTTLSCPRIDYETNDDGHPINACTGIIWRPDAHGDPEPTPDTGGELRFNVYPDAEGDFSEPGGRLVNHFMACDLVSQSCVCSLSDKEMDRLYEQAIEQAKDRDYE